MMTLTLLERIDDRNSRVRLSNERQQDAVLRVFGDNSYTVESGAKWLPSKIRGRALYYALGECIANGTATVEAK